MVQPQPPKVINVAHQYETRGEYTGGQKKGTGYTQDRVDNYWAVKSPVDTFRYADDGEEFSEYEEATTLGYTLLGGETVYIYDQSDIDGLRKLLSAIEADMAEGGVE